MKDRTVTLAPVRANAGLEAAFRRRLEAMIDEMDRSLLRWVVAAYRATPPEAMARDASPAATLNAIMRRLAKRWQRRFDEAAPGVAAHFATAAKDRTESALRAALKKAGFSVAFKPTRAIEDVLRAAVDNNVSLIRSVAQEHLADVEQLVMRSVMAGRDLGGLRSDLEARFDLTRKRARLIARQSNNDATAMVKRARERELGITRAVWVHSHGGRTPRPEHERWGRERKEYDVDKGMWSEVSQKHVWPGTDFNCRCVGRSVLPSLGDRTVT